MTQARIVLTTIDRREAAEKLARDLVERRLAACVNIVGPIRSVYRWNEEVHDDEEYLLVIKTTAEQAEQLNSVLKELHSYELPECVHLSVEDGSQEYLEWLAAQVSGR
jgi:periplasmic divalent cation tolerance protein